MNAAAELAAPTAVREYPILFRANLVRAILAGTKTQTRRIAKPQPIAWATSHGGEKYHSVIHEPCPFGPIGTRLWVRETFALNEASNTVHYAATPRTVLAKLRSKRRQPDPIMGHDVWEELTLLDRIDALPAPKLWHPSIHMPRRFCRLLLDITDVRLERLQEITDAGAIAEGIPAEEGRRPIRGNEEYLQLSGPMPLTGSVMTPRECFASLWDQIYGEGEWDRNPWVWTITFKRATP